ncbi:hypothetical protein ABEF93_006715 [Exophiala dermatitidis]
MAAPLKNATRNGSEQSEGKPNGVQEPAAAPGSITGFKILYAQKDKDDKIQWVTEEPADAVDPAENSETAQYAFLPRKKKSYDSRKKYDLDSIIVQSPWLKKSLGVILKDYPGVTTNLDRLVFKAPFHPFVHRWTRLEDMLAENEFDEPIAREHLQLFRDVLCEGLQSAIAAKVDLVKNGVITFEYLWTIFEPGALIYSVVEGKECLFEHCSCGHTVDQKRGLQMLTLNAWATDWDGRKFGRNHGFGLRIYEFEGTMPITSLDVFPLEFHPDKDNILQRLLARGRLFERFAGYHYRAYRGVALGYGRCGMIRHNIESRIIIDCDAHNRFLPGRAVIFSALAKPKTALPADVDMGGSTDSESSDVEDDFFYYTGDIDLDVDEFASKGPEHRGLTSGELAVAVPYVRGYALKTKEWLWFYVDQIESIKFSTDAFTSLVLPPEQKTLIRAFVECQIKHKDDFDDVIAGKGRGMIMLLAGPPGVGKTLTSESVAEDMRVPLYVLSAGDLGLVPSEIEETLNLVLDMVSKWNAVLLLDEADVFLEQRSTHDLERNKMVSIFLRVLEYYEGVLFLTTNRVKDIDEAFRSRIHITINYPNLSAESRRQIWQKFLGPDSALTGQDLDRLAQVDLNGRQIKNMVKTAQMLARSHETTKDGPRGEVQMSHIETILAIERGVSWE